ncbi:MAG: flagellar biosynthesis anti-sigma factor FlgM [Planctomycetota bacterium]|nr:flagellar biosynthesis anti-sigma factor FlgM [Planctomycetota bacterium]
MDVNAIGSVQRTAPVNHTQQSAVSQKQSTTRLSAPQDELEISEAARMLGDMQSNNDLRSERLAQIKAAINDGTYESDEKLGIALDKLMKEVNSPQR